MSSGLLYVCNGRGGDVWAYDLDSDWQHSATYAVTNADEIRLSRDLSVMYISDRGVHGGLDVTGGVVAIDTATGAHLWRVDVGGVPQHLEIDHERGLLYVPVLDRQYLAVIDIARRAVTARVPTGYGGHGAHFEASRDMLYVGSTQQDAMWVIDTSTQQVTNVFHFREGVRPFTLSSDGLTMFVQLSKMHGIVAVDSSTGAVRREVDLPTPLPDLASWPDVARLWPHTVNHGLGLVRSTGHLVACSTVTDEIVVLDERTLELVARVPVGQEPTWLVFNADQSLCAVSCRVSDEIVIVDVATWAEIRRLSAGRYPQRMAFTR